MWNKLHTYLKLRAKLYFRFCINTQYIHSTYTVHTQYIQQVNMIFPLRSNFHKAVLLEI
jgi:hypothetical protein